MNIIVVMRFDGLVTPSAFENAFDEALERHPTFLCRIQRRGGTAHWIEAPELRPAIDYATLGTPLEFPNGREAFDPKREAGIRVWVRSDAASTEITFQTFHGCADGIGLHRFIGDLLAAYGQRTAVPGAKKPVLKQLEPARLPDRVDRMFQGNDADAKPMSAWNTLIFGLRLFARSIMPVRRPPRSAPPEPKTLFPGIVDDDLDAEDYRRLRDAAIKLGITVNDLLVRDMFLTIDDWNGQRGFLPSRQRLRILVPSDLRGRDDELVPAANVVSYTYVNHRAADCKNPKRLAAQIRSVTAGFKHDLLGTNFIRALTTAARIPGLLSAIVPKWGCACTAIVTNVGDPARRYTARFPRSEGKLVAGNLTLESITGAPPLRKGTRVVLSVITYMKKLTVGVRCDPHLFGPKASRKFITMFMDRLRKSIAESEIRVDIPAPQVPKPVLLDMPAEPVTVQSAVSQ